MPLPSHQELVRLSRDRSFLVKASLAMTAGSALLALVVSLFASPGGVAGPDPARRVLDQAGSRETLIPLVRFGLPLSPDSKARSCAQLVKDGRRNLFAEEIEAAFEDLARDPEIEMVARWWEGLRAEDPAGAVAALNGMEAGRRYRNEFLADLHLKATNTETALRHYLAEAALFEDAHYARRSAIFLARFEEDKALVRELLGDRTFRRAFAAADLFPYHAFAGDYSGLARSVLLAEGRLLLSPFLVPALFTAAIWFLILSVFGNRLRPGLGISLIAFFLGTVSAALTLYAVILQEHLHGFRFHREDGAMSQFLYFLAGVALREEFLKILCFVPLALLIRKKGTPGEALILGGMVGLGFAFQENLVYFQAGSGSFTAWLRLLTANALHFSLTGVVALYLWRMLHRRGRGWEEFLVSFLAAVFAHGLYNALLAMPAMESYAPLGPILVALIAYQYFDPLRQHMDPVGQHRRFSPLGIFVLGSVVLTCTILVTAAAAQPFRFALGAFASSIGAMIPLAFAFISRFRDL